MKQIRVKKGEILQKSGDLNSKIFHVISGLLRSYAIDKKGREHIFMFGPEGWTVADNVSPDIPCDLYIDALEDSLVNIFPKNLKMENKNAPAFIKRIAVLQKRVIMLMSAPALERYEHFKQTYPEIIQRAPQKMIASYLGITPEALSNIKNKHLK
ncbi:Crp/Fnr family transcriptional regulator [Flavobacteriaceae bacterium MHTCC 0001]